MKPFTFISIAAALVIIPGFAVSYSQGYLDHDLERVHSRYQNVTVELVTEQPATITQITVPEVVIKVAPKSNVVPKCIPVDPEPVQEYCYWRPLEQGYGDVRVCENKPADDIIQKNLDPSELN